MFKDGNDNYTMLEAIREAKRCLHCKVPQCKKGCPISNDIPDWIHELSMGNLGNAMGVDQREEQSAGSLRRVCAHERRVRQLHTQQEG